MNIDITTIINAVIALIGAIVTYKVVPWIKTKTTVEQQKLLEATVKTLVFAAEQLYGALCLEIKIHVLVNVGYKCGLPIYILFFNFFQIILENDS